MPFQSGSVGPVTNEDRGVLGKGILLPWSDNPEGSYLYYDCTIGVALDSGIVVHNRLPQVNRASDTLGSIPYDDPDMNKEIVKGVNLKCQDQYADIMQRMGHSRYWFRLWGRAIRVGYKVPIPSIKTIGGVVAIPYDKNPQWAYNRVAPGGNFGGVMLWMAQWSLWYTTLTPPVNNVIPVADPSALVTSRDFPNGEPKLPDGIQIPLTQPDDNARSTPQTGSFLGR